MRLADFEQFCCFCSSGQNLLSFDLCKNIEAIDFHYVNKAPNVAELHESQAKEMIKLSYFQELRP